MSNINLKSDDNLEGVIFVIYPKPINYKGTVLEAVSSGQKVPKINEVLEVSEEIYKTFPELYGLFDLESVRNLKIKIDRSNGNVNILGVDSDGEIIDSKNTITYANNSGVYISEYEEPVEFFVNKSNTLKQTQYFDVDFTISETSDDGEILGISFSGDYLTLSNEQLNVDDVTYYNEQLNVENGTYYITNELNNLLISVVIESDVSGGDRTGVTYSITDYEILSSNSGYTVDENVNLPVFDSFNETIVNATLTGGTWSIPSSEIEDDYFYNINFKQEVSDGTAQGTFVNGFSGVFTREDNRFKYLESIIGLEGVGEGVGEVGSINEVLRPSKFLTTNIVLSKQIRPIKII